MSDNKLRDEVLKDFTNTGLAASMAFHSSNTWKEAKMHEDHMIELIEDFPEYHRFFRSICRNKLTYMSRINNLL